MCLLIKSNLAERIKGRRSLDWLNWTGGLDYWTALFRHKNIEAGPAVRSC